MVQIIKKIDNSNRIVIPTTVRDLLGVRPGDEVEFAIKDSNIILRKPDLEADKDQKKIVAEQLKKYGYMVPPEFL